jgi:glycosyltransferase involved in cell wall biosynthesis
MAIDQKLSVCFIIGQLGMGGSEKQLYLLTRELISRNWRVNVISINPSTGDYWEPQLKQLGISVSALPQTAGYIDRLAYIVAILKKANPMIVHSWSFYTNAYAAICGFLAGIPVRLGSERCNQNYSRQTLGRWKYAMSLIGLHGLVTNNELEAQQIKSQSPKLWVEVISNGLADDDLLSRVKAREILGIRDDCILIAGIGSLTLRKNFEYLIDVIAKIYLKLPPTKLLIIGAGPERNKLLKRATELMPIDCFMFTGNVPNVYRLLRGIDVLCAPSLDEGMPNVIMEACAAGTPVVANNVGAIPSLIKDELNGFVVEVGAESKFIRAIEKLVCDKKLRTEMGNAGQQLMHTEFGLQRMADRFVSLYQRMADF